MISQADRMLRDHVARELFVQRLMKAPDDPNKQPNATLVAYDALRDADAFVIARNDHDKISVAKPGYTPSPEIVAAAKGAGIPLEDDDELAG